MANVNLPQRSSGNMPAVRAAEVAPAPAIPAGLWDVLVSTAVNSAEFYSAWLALQCGMVSGTTAGLLLIRQQNPEPDAPPYMPVAAWPDAQADLGPLARIAQQAAAERRSVVARGRIEQNGAQQQASGALIAHPIGAPNEIPFAVTAVAVAPKSGSFDPQAIARQLHWGAGWLEMLLARYRVEEGAQKVAYAEAGLDLLSIAGEHKRLDASLMAIANELARRFVCERVSVGIVTQRRDGVKLQAMSHAATFQQKSQAAGAIENAMEEALDQNATVVYPASPVRIARIAVAHKGLAKTTGDRAAIASVVMASQGLPMGVITLERHRDEPFSEESLKLAEAVAALIGPMVALQNEGNRWITGRARALAHDQVQKLFGPRHPMVKLIASGLAVFVLLTLLLKGEHDVSAKSVVEGIVQRAVVAPFDGYIKTAPLRAGDVVHKGDVLAAMDDKDLTLDQLKANSEHEKLVQKYRDALAKHDRAEMVALSAEARQAEAQLALANEKLARTKLVAPFDGLVVSGDLSRMLGTPVEKGKTLFEVAPLEAYRIVVQVDERDVRYVEAGQTGRLAVSGLPSHPLTLAVQKVTPVATAEEGRNYFRVEASLDDKAAALRPGMEGVAKIAVGRASFAWIWTHSLFDWLRLFLWKWLP